MSPLFSHVHSAIVLAARNPGNGTKMHLGSASGATLDAWIALQILSGNIFLPILVATFFFAKSIKRHPLLMNLCLTWIISGTSSLLLFYAGKERGPEPPKPLCITQTSLLYGVTPMWSVAVLMLMVYISLQYRKKSEKSWVAGWRLVVMLVAPYLTLATFAIATAALSVQQPHHVNRARRFFYCSYQNDSFTNAMQIFTLIVCLVIICVEVDIIIQLYRHFRGVRKAGMSGGVDLQLAARVVIFGIYIFIGMILDLVSIITPYNQAPDIYAATIGLFVFLVFGSQRDVLRAWAFWRWGCSWRLGRGKGTKILTLPQGLSRPRSFNIDGSEKDLPLNDGDSILTLQPGEQDASLGQVIDLRHPPATWVDNNPRSKRPRELV